MAFRLNPITGELDLIGSTSGSSGSAITFTADTGTATESGGILLLTGNSTQGLTTSASSNDVVFTVSDATTSQKGVSRLATDAEAIAGSISTNVAIVPSSLKAKLGTQTSHGIAYGAGTTGAIGWTSGLTDGQLIIGSTSGVPIAGNITAGTGITITNAAGSISIASTAGGGDFFGPASSTLNAVVRFADTTGKLGKNSTVIIDNSGNTSGIGTLSATSGTFSGLSANRIVTTTTGGLLQTAAALTDGQILIGSTGSSPVAAALTAGTGISITNGAGSVTVNASSSVPTTFTGDTGNATPTANNINIIGTAAQGISTSAVGATMTLTVGDATTSAKGVAKFSSTYFSVSSGNVSLLGTVPQVIHTDSGDATPSGSAFTIAGSGAVSTSGSGSTVTVASAGISNWVVDSGTSRTLTVNQGVIFTSASLMTATLPTTAAVGSTIKLICSGTGLFKVAQNASQVIHLGIGVTTTGTGGSLTAKNLGDTLELICTVANTTWYCFPATGSFDIV